MIDKSVIKKEFKESECLNFVLKGQQDGVISNTITKTNLDFDV